MKLIYKILIVVGTLALMAAILLVAFARPPHNQVAELEVALAYCEPKSPEIVEELQVAKVQTPPEIKTNDIIETPEIFLAFLEAQLIEEAHSILLTDKFINELKLYQENKYAAIYTYEELPLPVVSDILMFMERAVGGNYIFGAQGYLLTKEVIDEANMLNPDYFDSGRLEYFYERSFTRNFNEINKTPTYPKDYAWDCSGLFWDCINTLDVLEKYTDKTADETFKEFCTPITKEELRPGDLVFYRGKVDGPIYHMGIVGYDGYVYEAASGFVGVVKTQSLDVRIYEDLVRGGYLVYPLWNEFGRPNFYE